MIGVAVLSLAAAAAALAIPTPAPSPTPPASTAPPTDPQATPTPAPGETREYRNAELAFSMRLPAGWRDLSSLELNAFNTLLPEPQRKNPYIAGFVAAAPGDFDYPYLLIQHIPTTTTGAAWEDIERAFGAVQMQAVSEQVQESLSDLVTNVNLETPTVDRTRNRVVQCMTGQQAGSEGNRFRALTVMNLGRDRVVAIHAYQIEDRFAEELPVFSAAADSFRFDRGAEFVPSSPLSPSLGLARSAIVGGVIGVAVAGTVAVLLARKKGRKNA
jgi:hypothetical protein